MITLEIDLNDEKQLRATKAFIDTMLGAEIPKEEQATETPKEEASKRAAKNTSGDAAKAEPQKSTEPAKEKQQPAEPDKGTPEEAREITTDDVKAKVAVLVSKHKAAMQGKLKELGVKRVADLQEHQYEAFYQFMEGLENG